MKRTRQLDYLFPRLRQQILSTTLLHPETSYYLRELAAKVEATPSSIQKELQNLVNAGLLKRSNSGNRTYFQADISSPFFLEFQSILKKSVGIVDVVQHALEPLGTQINAAFIYGSFATPAGLGNRSDIDLMVIGEVSTLDLSAVLSGAEAKLGRDINVTVYTVQEYRSKLLDGNHFLATVTRSEKLPILGDLDVLATTSA